MYIFETIFATILLQTYLDRIKWSDKDIPIEWNKTTAYNKRVSAGRKKARLEKEGVSQYQYKNVTPSNKQYNTNLINENGS